MAEQRTAPTRKGFGPAQKHKHPNCRRRPQTKSAQLDTRYRCRSRSGRSNSWKTRRCASSAAAMEVWWTPKPSRHPCTRKSAGLRCGVGSQHKEPKQSVNINCARRRTRSLKPPPSIARKSQDVIFLTLKFLENVHFEVIPRSSLSLSTQARIVSPSSICWAAI